MRQAFRPIFLFFLHIGPFGLLLLGVLDSSFLFVPLGNDLLLVALTVRDHALLPLYVAMAVCGSTLGCYLLDLSVRTGGKAGLKLLLPGKRVEYMEKKIADHAATALLVATLAPPPFPFTVVIAAVAALNYPRAKMLAVIAGGRAVRFSILGLLAIWLGRHILRITRTPAFEWSMTAFVALCIIGSSISIYNWMKRSRSAGWVHGAQ